MEPLRVPQTALRLLQRCNNAPFVFHFAERRTLALIPADGSNCKALKIRYYMVSAPSRPPICFEPRRIATLHLFCFCFSKANVRFPSRRRRSIFVFCFPQNMERSVTLHILQLRRTLVLSFCLAYPRHLYPQNSEHGSRKDDR